MFMSVVGWFLGAILFVVNAGNEAVRIGECNQALIEDLRLDIISRIYNFKRFDTNGFNDPNPLLPTLLRLVFHDCGGSSNVTDPNSPGICNGCINIEDPDHAGLEFGAIYPLLQVYRNQRRILRGSPDFGNRGTKVDGTFRRNPSGTTWSDIMSLSDFWSISGTIAVEFGTYLSYIKDSDVLPGQLPSLESYGIDINYYYGRQDCSTAPFETTLFDFFNTDETRWDFDDALNFLSTKFGFDDEDTIAIMGIHTVGRGHPTKDIASIGKKNMYKDDNCCSGSGIPHRWKNTRIDTFNNLYYIRMDNAFPEVWSQTPSNQAIDDPTGFSDKLIWTLFDENGPVNDGLMLNVDMTLFMNIDDNPLFSVNGTVNCKHPNDTISPNAYKPACTINQVTLEEFLEYRDDNFLWLEAFMIAWDKMIQAGYNNLKVIKKDWATSVADYEAILADIEKTFAVDAFIKNDEPANNIFDGTNIFEYYTNHFDIRVTLINITILLALIGVFICIKRICFRPTKAVVKYAHIDADTTTSDTTTV